MVDLPDRSRSSMGAIGTLYQVASEWEARQKSINSDPQIPMVRVKRKLGSCFGVEAFVGFVAVNPGISRPVHAGHDLPGMRQSSSLPCPGLCLRSICQSGWQRMRGGSRITPWPRQRGHQSPQRSTGCRFQIQRELGAFCAQGTAPLPVLWAPMPLLLLGILQRCSTGRPEAWKAVSNFPQFSFFGGPAEGAVAWRRCCRCYASQSTPPASPDGVEGQV